MNARPRQATDVEVEELENDCLRLTDKRGLNVLDLNSSSVVIWRHCDGSRTTNELIKLFSDTYPDHKSIAKEVLDAIDSLNNSNLLVFDGGDDALEYQGDVVRLLTPNVKFHNNLENIREFLFTELKVMEAEEVDSNLEKLLGDDALINAMQLDADSAGGVNDSKVISYSRAMKLPSIVESLETIVQEIQIQLPEVKSEIEVSGNAIYLRGSHMGWHSNHSRSDGRTYCSWTEKADSNFFRYQHPITGEIITEWEQPGWNIKSFTIPPKPYRFWHCIGAESLRLSLGFRYNLPKG